jgi:signal transduction histidine kinase
MSATTAAASGSDGSTRRPNSDPLPNHVLALTLAAALLVILGVGLDTIIRTAEDKWNELLFWVVPILAANLSPIWVNRAADVVFTLDMPLMIAVALLYPPPVASAVALLGCVDVREFGLRVPLIRIVFNRTQVALTVWAAGITFHHLSSGLEPWQRSILATIAAVAVSHSLNVMLVSTYTGLRLGTGFLPVMRGLKVGRIGQFLVIYIGYCVLALVLARLFTDVGEWSVVIFFIPIAVAHQMLVRGQRLQTLAAQLRGRERLLERLSERIVEERRDERMRIASELHDEILQCLVKIGLSASLLNRDLPRDSPGRRDVAELINDTDFSKEELRRIIHDLQRSPLGRGGLIPTIRALARDLQLDWRVKVSVEAPDELQLSADTQLVAYQVAREALINALKHAKATEVQVCIRDESEWMSLAIEDNGVGFDIGSVDPSMHFGLGLLRERVRLAYGEVGITSLPGSGTRILVRLPTSSRFGSESRIGRPQEDQL